MKKSNLKLLWYTLCAVLFFSLSAIAQEKIAEPKEEKGDLLLVEAEYVSPANAALYEEWAVKFKKIADDTAFENFFVGSNEQAYFYVWNVGKTAAGLDEHRKAYMEWMADNKELGELYDKYSHTVEYRKQELWYQDVENSYRPEGYKPSQDNTYTRQFFGYINIGKEKDANALLKEYKAEWKAKNIASPYTVYWNVFGTEKACMLVIQSYKDKEAWLADEKNIMEKVGKEKLGNWNKRWSNVLRKMEEKESYPRYDLSHFKNPEEATTKVNDKMKMSERKNKKKE